MRGRAPRSAAGFTLLEILVVIAIAAVLMGTVVLGFTGADDAQRLRGLAERIAVRVELARENALQRNREWGVQVEKNAYRFVEFDPMSGKWQAQSFRPFVEKELTPRIEFWVSVEGLGLPEDALAQSFDGQADGLGQTDGPQRKARREKLPDILIFSSGEVTPFEWTLTPTWEGNPWVVSSDGLAPARAAPRA